MIVFAAALGSSQTSGTDMIMFNGCVNVTAIEDSLIENPELVLVMISRESLTSNDVAGTPSVIQVTIIDNDGKWL